MDGFRYDDDGDTESVFGDSSRMSLDSDLRHYRIENNRKYHAYRDGEYWAPHDDEALRLDIYAHHMFILTLNNELFLAPLRNPKRVIDIGTGIGIWASDVADKFPGAEVIGTDLSPTNKATPAENLRFEIDDCCSEWVYPLNHFDYVHVRFLYASVADWPAFYKECFDHIAPGGYIEHSEPTPEFISDDGSIAPDDVLHRLTSLAVEAGEKFGKNMLIAPHIKNMIEEAGFVNIVERRYKWPLGEWPVDQKLKDIGRWNLQHWLEGLDAWTLRLLTQYCGWTPDEVKEWTAQMRTSLMDPKHHTYHMMYVIFRAHCLYF
ncbi:S-adenosyl-L-methionine-dependent methyltransferase [Usnea florida]